MVGNGSLVVDEKNDFSGSPMADFFKTNGSLCAVDLPCGLLGFNFVEVVRRPRSSPQKKCTELLDFLLSPFRTFWLEHHAGNGTSISNDVSVWSLSGHHGARDPGNDGTKLGLIDQTNFESARTAIMPSDPGKALENDS